MSSNRGGRELPKSQRHRHEFSLCCMAMPLGLNILTISAGGPCPNDVPARQLHNNRRFKIQRSEHPLFILEAMLMLMLMQMMMMMMMDRGKLLEASSPGSKVLPLLGRFQMHSTLLVPHRKPPQTPTYEKSLYLRYPLPPPAYTKRTTSALHL